MATVTTTQRFCTFRIYRISDFNGSGLSLHGGQDKADTYILIWAVDEAAMKRVIEGYSGQKTEIVNVSAPIPCVN